MRQSLSFSEIRSGDFYQVRQKERNHSSWFILCALHSNAFNFFQFSRLYIDKCVVKSNQGHCQPVWEHVNGLDNQTLFEAYVNSFPIKWNMHFFPQSFYCDGLYRHLDSYDFVGRMSPSFYHDLEQLGRQFGGTLPAALEKVFHISNKLNITNQGIETSASSLVLDYYTPKTLRQVLEYYAIDYVLLDIPIPDWAKQMLQQ
jgi:hypothetical protein